MHKNLSPKMPRMSVALTFLIFSPILIFSTKLCTENSVWSLASSGKWPNLWVKYCKIGYFCVYLDIWSNMWVKYLVTIWWTFGGHLVRYVGEWVRYLVQKGQQWSAVRPGLDLKLAHGQCSRQNVQTQLVGPLATWEGKLSQKNGKNPNSLLLHWTRLN